MSGVFAILGASAAAEEGALRRVLGQSRARGPDQANCWTSEDGILGVCRADWELGADFADGAMVLERPGLVLVADASLYYREDLRRALIGAGCRPEGTSPSHLIAAAYEAWGPAMLDVLEGDYAFVLWDRRKKLLIAARDFAGIRPLYFATAGDRLVVASRMLAVAAHPALPRDLNPASLLEDLVVASSVVVEETALRAVRRLPAGCRLTWQPGRAPQVQRFWEPPQFDHGDGASQADAADQLRGVLREAVRERMATSSPTAVWTSGGYDSPAVFALAHDVASHGGTPPVVPVSMSYPEGDPGREDELVEAVGRHTGASIHWVKIADVPGLPDPSNWAAGRDQPFAHPYYEWNRALGRASREAGARVVLGGNGGDQFFSVSPVFLADLARGGHWLELFREARAIGFGRHNLREFFHWGIQPALPASVLKLAAVLRGSRPLKPHLLSVLPAWMQLDRPTRETLWHRQWNYSLRRRGETLGSAESAWYLLTGFGQRICAMVMDIVFEQGAEVRSPMYDRRVIEFMARRPRTDRYYRGETKCLLRQSMVGLLPAEHLAPRTRRTGLPSNYLKRVRREALPEWAELLGSNYRLAELGLAQPAVVRAALDRYQATPNWEGSLGSELFNLFSLEFWIRAHAELADLPDARVA